MFRLSKYRQPIIDLLTQNPGFCQPEERRLEILKMLGQDLMDLSVSRTKFSWGIPMPEGFDQGHVMCVACLLPSCPAAMLSSWCAWLLLPPN